VTATGLTTPRWEAAATVTANATNRVNTAGLGKTTVEAGSGATLIRDGQTTLH